MLRTLHLDICGLRGERLKRIGANVQRVEHSRGERSSAQGAIDQLDRGLSLLDASGDKAHYAASDVSVSEARFPSPNGVGGH
ncbi:hypothetical protein [Paraburkholderia sp. J67]|uniref:hypothetical protein n=1 Tax=Paraburkholderia sp. J67 TaxID=2805435 RepID=UPI002ABD65D5|nr:hypothetical protein [Paraburkholderia sp. J67]